MNNNLNNWISNYGQMHLNVSNHSDCWISNKCQMSVNKTHYSDRSKKLVHVWYLYWISYESQMNFTASDCSDNWIPSKYQVKLNKNKNTQVNQQNSYSCVEVFQPGFIRKLHLLKWGQSIGQNSTFCISACWSLFCSVTA